MEAAKSHEAEISSSTQDSNNQSQSNGDARISELETKLTEKDVIINYLESKLKENGAYIATLKAKPEENKKTCENLDVKNNQNDIDKINDKNLKEIADLKSELAQLKYTYAKKDFAQMLKDFGAKANLSIESKLATEAGKLEFKADSEKLNPIIAPYMRYWDDKTKKVYYCAEGSQSSIWDLPEEQAEKLRQYYLSEGKWDKPAVDEQIKITLKPFQKFFDDKQRRTYYFNKETNQSIWSLPVEIRKKVRQFYKSNNIQEEEAIEEEFFGLIEPWISWYDLVKGRFYYNHEETKESVWELPDEIKTKIQSYYNSKTAGAV